MCPSRGTWLGIGEGSQDVVGIAVFVVVHRGDGGGLVFAASFWGSLMESVELGTGQDMPQRVLVSLVGDNALSLPGNCQIR